MAKIHENRKRAAIAFAAAFILIVILLVISVLKTKAFNSMQHEAVFAGENLFTSEEGQPGDVTVRAAPRSSTWGKIFDFYDEGLTENNYQAYTYDFTVSNNTKDEVSTFLFKLTFSHEAFLASAWNGALEIHQNVGSGELVATVPDLREFDPTAYDLEIITVDGESFIDMKAGDYLIYHPSSTMNALEMPIEAFEGTVPGIIMYVEMGESIEGSSLELDYTFYRPITGEPLFWVSLVLVIIWLIVLITFAVISAQIRMYEERHERDNEIINESIETFTGFIDAKDPYTNGHSKRVAKYTRLLARHFGYEGEELDKVYYIALLHDCGKIGVPDNILGKPSRLTEEEFNIIKSHTLRGGEILSSFKSLEDADEGALYHHERYDGKGYPEGRKGEDIPFIARMICVADSFDAMNSNRVYRKKLTAEDILRELEQNKGAQFDPKVVDVMLGLLRDGTISMD